MWFGNHKDLCLVVELAEPQTPLQGTNRHSVKVTNSLTGPKTRVPDGSGARLDQPKDLLKLGTSALFAERVAQAQEQSLELTQRAFRSTGEAGVQQSDFSGAQRRPRVFFRAEQPNKRVEQAPAGSHRYHRSWSQRLDPHQLKTKGLGMYCLC